MLEIFFVSSFSYYSTVTSPNIIINSSILVRNIIVNPNVLRLALEGLNVCLHIYTILCHSEQVYDDHLVLYKDLPPVAKANLIDAYLGAYARV